MIKDLGERNKLSISTKTQDKINVTFQGSDNEVVIDAGENIGVLNIVCDGDGNRVEIRKTRRIGSLRILAKNGGSVVIGDLSSFEECYILAERAKVEIGRDFMASFQTSLRTTDAHGIYSLETGELLNPPGDIRIGDHVWIGQGALISKGARIDDNVVVAARAFVQKTQTPKNCIIGGVPAKVLRENVVWDRRMTANLFAPDANMDGFLHQFLPDPSALKSRRSKPKPKS